LAKRAFLETPSYALEKSASKRAVQWLNSAGTDRNGVPPPVSGVPPPEIAVPPPNVVVLPPGNDVPSPTEGK